MDYEPCVLDADGNCLRWSHDHATDAEKREAAVQAMIDKGHTRERAERLLFDVVPRAIFGADLPGMWEESDLAGGWADSSDDEAGER